MSEQLPATVYPDEPPPHPIHLVVTDDLQRSRLTVFFRLLLVIPHLIVLTLWGIVVWFVVVIAWIVSIFTGRVPDGLRNFIAMFLRYLTHVYAYCSSLPTRTRASPASRATPSTSRSRRARR